METRQLIDASLLLLCVSWFLLQGPTDKEQIDVQGDIAYDIVDYISETWPDVIIITLTCSFKVIIAFLFYVHDNKYGNDQIKT